MGSSLEADSHISRLTLPDNPAPYPVAYSVIRPVNHSEEVPEVLSVLAWRSVYHLDRMLEVFADSSDFPFVSRLASKEETVSAQNSIIRTVVDSVRNDRDVRVHCLLYGMHPVMMNIADSVPSDRKNQIVPIRMHGYERDQAVTVELDTPLKSEHAVARISFGVDDVFDTGHELIAFLCEIEEHKFGNTDRSIIDAVFNKDRRPFDELRPLYDDAIARFHTAGVVISVLCYKNMPFKEQLRAYIQKQNPQDEWCVYQEELLDYSLDFGQNDWVIASGMDKGISGNDIVGLIMKDGLLDPWMCRDEKVQMIVDSLQKTELRIGSLADGILRVNNPKILDELAASMIGLYIHQFASSR